MSEFSLLMRVAKIVSSRPKGLEESELADLGGIFVKDGEHLSARDI